MRMDLQEQLTKHLTDVHAIEEQALQQMVVAPRDWPATRSWRRRFGNIWTRRATRSGACASVSARAVPTRHA